MTNSRCVPLLLLLSALLAACDGDEPAADQGVVADSAPDAGGVAILPAGGDGHGDVGAVLASGQVRAGKVTAATQLLSGPKVEGKVGDIKIYNDRVAFIIVGNRPSGGAAPFGGEVADAARLDVAEPISIFGETSLAMGVHVVEPTSVGVVHDGSDGKAALVRVIGKPVLFPPLGALFGAALGSMPDLDVVLDYSLEPDADALQIQMRVFNSTGETAELPMLVANMSGGDGVEFFAGPRGFDVSLAPRSDTITAVGPQVSYALHSPEAELTPIIQYEGLWLHTADGFNLPHGAQTTRLYQLAVGRGDPEGLWQVMRELRGDPQPPELTVTVVDGANAPVAGARVHVLLADDSYVTMARTDASGEARLRLADGDYSLNVVADGRAPLRDQVVTVSGGGSTTLTVGGFGTVDYAVTDADSNTALPCKISIIPLSTPTPLPASLGEPTFKGSAELVQFAQQGTGVVQLPPAGYRVVASRGFEYELAEEQVAVADGSSQSLTLQLKRSVDSTGALCGDFHLHGFLSHDSSDTYELKVRSLAAEGLEVAVLSEHDYIGDLTPAAKSMQLDSWVHTVVGEEISTFNVGHFNAFPLTPRPELRNAGAVEWVNKTPGDVFAEVRGSWPGALVQVNHPRSPSVVGYFTVLDFDPETAKPTKQPEQWSTDFDSMEVFNGKRLVAGEVWDKASKEAVRDWFSLLNHGLLVTATGGSDSHLVTRDIPGYPRNYILVGSDLPGGVSEQQLVSAIKAQRVVVSGGPLIDLSVGGKGVGQVASAPSGAAEAQIRVQAPTWMPVDTLRVIVGGKEVHTVTLDAGTRDPQNPVVRFNGTLPLQVSADSWVVAVVTGEGTLDPVVPGEQPFGLTNPVYLDVNGDGDYDPPLSSN